MKLLDMCPRPKPQAIASSIYFESHRLKATGAKGWGGVKLQNRTEKNIDVM
jgi:hypothetical protein